MESSINLGTKDNDDKDLIEDAKRGNHEAFSKIISQYQSSIYRITKSILNDDTDCADSIQETIIKAYLNLKHLHNNEKIKSWLLKIAVNESKRLLKKKKREFPAFQSQEEIKGNDNVSNIEIMDSIDMLNKDLKIVVMLYYFEDLSIEAISKILLIPKGTVKSRLSRARSQLKDLLSLKKEEI